MAGRSIEFLTGEDASYVAYWGERWWKMDEKQKQGARITLRLGLLHSERRIALIKKAYKEAKDYEDPSLYFEILSRELGINGWPSK